MSDPRFITLVSAQPPITVTAMRGEQPPVPAGGYGGWNLVERPRRKSLTEWGGIEPLRVIVPIVIGMTPAGDLHALDQSAEPDREKLERLARPPSEGAEPPLVRVIGAVPHATSVDWVVEDLEWDNSPLYSLKGFVVRQAVTVHLLEAVTDDRAQTSSAADQARRKAVATAAHAAAKAGAKTTQQPKTKVYVVHAGDTLMTIAARLLGSYKRYVEIAALNSIRDPNRLTVGQKLRIP